MAAKIAGGIATGYSVCNMIGCFGSGEPHQPPAPNQQSSITNDIVVNGNISRDEETHIEINKEAIMASGATAAAFIVLAILIYWCYNHRQALTDATYVRAQRAARKHAAAAFSLPIAAPHAIAPHPTAPPAYNPAYPMQPMQSLYPPPPQ